MRGHLYHCRVRGIALGAWIRLWGGTVGARLLVDGGVHLRHPPSRHWVIGKNVYIGRGTILDVWPGASLRIGDRTKVMHYSIFGVRDSLWVGDDAQIAEHCTVRDANHDIVHGRLMATAPMQSTPIRVGNGAWIARGCAVLRGASVGDGAVIGANSVVTGPIPENAVAVGSPARVIRDRRQAT